MYFSSLTILLSMLLVSFQTGMMKPVTNQNSSSDINSRDEIGRKSRPNSLKRFHTHSNHY